MEFLRALLVMVAIGALGFAAAFVAYRIPWLLFGQGGSGAVFGLGILLLSLLGATLGYRCQGTVLLRAAAILAAVFGFLSGVGWDAYVDELYRHNSRNLIGIEIAIWLILATASLCVGLIVGDKLRESRGKQVAQ